MFAFLSANKQFHQFHRTIIPSYKQSVQERYFSTFFPIKCELEVASVVNGVEVVIQVLMFHFFAQYSGCHLYIFSNILGGDTKGRGNSLLYRFDTRGRLDCKLLHQSFVCSILPRIENV